MLDRSFLYLLAAKQFYDYTIQKEMSAASREAMETTLTQNLFYLAQAYGFIGNTELSALYCHMVRGRARLPHHSLLCLFHPCCCCRQLFRLLYCYMYDCSLSTPCPTDVMLLLPACTCTPPQTLQRQLSKGFDDTRDMLSWCSNCMGMVDFHVALRDLPSAAHALAVAEQVLKEHLQLRPASDENSKDKTAELEVRDGLASLVDECDIYRASVSACSG